jgi:hypothetical protein
MCELPGDSWSAVVALRAAAVLRKPAYFVADLWREAGLQPHRIGTFKVPLSTDPDFEAKVS